MTPKEIAEKYVYGNHDAFTDNQEIKDMIADITKVADDAYDKGFQDGNQRDFTPKLK